MIIPKYWAEGRARSRSGKKQVTARRFGWSNLSQEEAQIMADKRAEEALQQLLGGEKVHPREAKVSYNGAEGIPIREEVVSERGAAVITRNIYGALCLNTPDVLFADVDLPTGPRLQQTVTVVMVVIALFVGSGVYWHSFALGLVGFVATLLLGASFSRLLYRMICVFLGTEEKRAGERLDAFLRRNPSWSVRVYHTPAGLRLLVTHRTFSPEDPDVLEFFASVWTDTRYVAMCRNQQCFRARLTPKPWRIGIADHVKPRPGVWPINPERMPDRRAWIARYELESKSYSACRYVSTLGSGVIDSSVEAVQKIHDEQSKALSALPIA